MVQLYDKAAVSVEDDIIDNLGDVIDPYVLASMVVGAIADEYGQATYEMAAEFWRRALDYRLPRLFAQIAREIPDPANA
jgi:hypothetical protein